MNAFVNESTLESANNRPSDAEQDRLMALYGERRRARLAKTFTLRSSHESIAFAVDGDIVEITRRNLRGSWITTVPAPVTMTRYEARAEWARLRDHGYWVA